MPRPRPAAMRLAIAALLLSGMTAIASAQPESGGAAPEGSSGQDLDQMLRESATGLALPNHPVKAGLQMRADQTRSWQRDGHRFVLLRGDVSVAVGSYGFEAAKALVRLTDRELPGRTARDAAIYLDRVRALGGSGPVKQRAERLLVTAVPTGKVELTTDSLKRRRAQNAFVRAGLQRIRQHEKRLAANTADVPDGKPLYGEDVFAKRRQRRSEVRGKRPELPAEIAERRPELPDKPAPEKPAGGAPEKPPEEAPEKPAKAEKPEKPPQRVAPGAQVDFHAGKVVYKSKRNEGYVLLTDGLQVVYANPETGRRITLRADRGVIFTDPDAVGGGARSADAEAIRGVYLEDNVIATNGDYTLRGPRLFYDLKRNEAVVLDAVFYTWDVDRQVPLYVRAWKLRQHSDRSWSAHDAKLTTSEFHQPHFAIGTDRLTIDKQENGPGESEGGSYRFNAEGVTLEAGGTPLFYWPSMSGEARDVPIESASIGGQSRRGVTVETRWDLFSMLDQDKPDGVDADLLIDGFSKRGPGVGIDADYDTDNTFGVFDGYYLHDSGEDEPGGRLEVEPETENRGKILWRHRHELGDGWEARAEVAWLSDPTFLEEFFPDDAHGEKDYETVFHLKQQRRDWAFTFESSVDLLDFEPQSGPLQTRGTIFPGGAPSAGYSTEKFPELSYQRIGTSLWGDRLTWFSENRASVMRLNLPEDNPSDRGFTAAHATALFGMRGAGATTTDFGSALRGSGLDQQTRIRGDTRQEVRAPMELGIFNVTPYATGRVTAYDDGFEDFSGSDDQTRLFGGVGVEASTSFSSTNGQIHSDLLGLHRLRHTIEPYAELFYGSSTIDQSQLPVYDYTVESLAEGGIVSVGMRNTFATQRGGPGRWRSVDWIELDTRFVFSQDQTRRESPIGRFFPSRPENSLAGDFVYNELTWRISDTLALVANANYNFDASRMARWNIGLNYDHTPRLTSFLTYRDIDAMDSAIVSYGFDYKLTAKYHASFSQSFDLEENEGRNVTVTLTRRLPRWLMIVTVDHDTIDDVTSVGLAFAPEGFSGAGPQRNPFLIR